MTAPCKPRDAHAIVQTAGWRRRLKSAHDTGPGNDTGLAALPSAAVADAPAEGEGLMGDERPQMYPHTEALRRVIGNAGNSSALADLLFLEAWERAPNPQLGATLRAHQIRRANPLLAAEISAELSRGRPLTALERTALTGGSAGRQLGGRKGLGAAPNPARA